MISMAKRNLQIYFHHKSTVFFSLMGAWISFALYLIFLKQNMLDAWSDIGHPDKMLDQWIMGGTLAVASVTTVWTGVTRLVYDRESHKLEDFLLTDQSYFSLMGAYLISSSLIGIIMQVATYSVMMLYFVWKDGLTVVWGQMPQLFLVIVLSGLLSASIGLILVAFINRAEVSERLSVIIGTASGFLVGVYMPIGSLPDSAQAFIKCTPWAYVASSYRHILMKGTILNWQRKDMSVEEFLGLGLKLKHLTSLHEEILLISSCIGVSLVLLFIVQFVKKRKID